jgi:hypothetical protein
MNVEAGDEEGLAVGMVTAASVRGDIALGTATMADGQERVRELSVPTSYPWMAWRSLFEVMHAAATTITPRTAQSVTV